jgi:hypothetical protein
MRRSPGHRLEESIMGSWDAGPFENDMAADFAFTLDEAPLRHRVEIVRNALIGTIDTRGYLDSQEGSEAVAAAALIAARCPGAEPVNSSYGPKEALPVFPGELKALAVAALDRVLGEASELADLWDESGDGQRWRRSIVSLRQVLDPQPGASAERRVET